ncbi:MAG TPA: hypothetical protein VF599_05640 [Pyrinomonadaceae bacterium]|jgi:hypothetical protein
MKRLIGGFMILLFALFVALDVKAQKNLLLNPNADAESDFWRKSGQANVEEFNGDKVFVVRNKGGFSQDIVLSEADANKYAVLIGRGSSERINADGAITGLPYLYVYFLNEHKPDGSIIKYLQGKRTLLRIQVKDEWGVMFGVFQVPKGTTGVRFFLHQAERLDVPQNGSAARFDNLGLYLFETEEDALKFVNQYK